MSQRRYFNFGAAVSAPALNEAVASLTTKGVLKGGETFIIQPNILVIQPVIIVFATGIIMYETESTQLVIPFSSINRSFSITYRHNDGGLIGGTGAVLQAEPGFISNDDPSFTDGVVLAYVKYPGTGALAQTHIYESPKATLDATVTIGDGDYRLPPFTEGFALISQSPSIPVVTPTTTTTGTFAEYAYVNDGGIIDFTARLSGESGNTISFNFVDDAPAATPEEIEQIAPTQFKIHLAKDGGGDIASTADSMSTFLTTDTSAAALAFQNLATAVLRAGSVGTAPVALFPPGNTGGDLYQNLSGGVTGEDICYQIVNDTAVDKTHVLKWVFVARKNAPRSIVLEFSLGGASTIVLSAADTNGSLVTLDVPTDLVQSSGLTRRIVRITDGDFISGQRYFIQATILTKAGNTTLLTYLGASHYNLPF